MKEIWREIEGYEGFYEVSNLGRVRSWRKKWGRLGDPDSKLVKPRILETYVHPSHDFKSVSLRKVNKRLQRTENIRVAVHRLVARYFLSSWRGGCVVVHLDGNKLNNIYSNLSCCSKRDISSRRFLNGSVSSKYTGVTRVKAGWLASIRVKGVSYHICHVKDELVAAKAYQEVLDHVGEDIEDFKKSIKRVRSKYSRKQASRYKGVYFEKNSGKWRAETRLNGKKKYIGLFHTEREAYEARKRFLKRGRS